MESYSILESHQAEEPINFASVFQDNISSVNFKSKNRIRLRVVQTEQELFLKLIPTRILRKAVWVHGIFSGLIILLQVTLYAITHSKDRKFIDDIGVGIWGPLFFFSVACLLSHVATKEPSGCVLGTAIGFHVASLFVGSLIVLLATVSIGWHGHYATDKCTGQVSYTSEAHGIILCILMVLSAMGVIITSLYSCILLCKVTCCGQFRARQSLLFDVECLKN